MKSAAAIGRTVAPDSGLARKAAALAGTTLRPTRAIADCASTRRGRNFVTSPFMLARYRG